MLFYPVSIPAILVSMAISTVLGALWRPRIPAARIAGTFIMIYTLSQILHLSLISSAAEGATIALLVWIGFVAATHVPEALVKNKVWTRFLAGTGFYLLVLVVSGAILGYFS